VSTLAVGLSTRAIAESAVRGGHRIITIDYFGDRDQAALVDNLSLMRDLRLGFSPGGLLQASRQVGCQNVIYLSNLENYPNVVDELARDRTLLGNPSSVLRRVRDWGVLQAFCRQSGISFPETRLAGEEPGSEPGERWLLKPVHGGGGHGVRPWSGEPLDEAHFLQRLVPGQPASAAFVANGRRCVVLGLTEQLIGRAELGAQGFRWCGNILPLSLPVGQRAAVVEQVQSMARRLTEEFGLRGLNGIDLVVSDGGTVHLIEVNPRYTASMELVERAFGLNMFSLHLEAMDGRLLEKGPAGRTDGPWHGKGIVYARQAVTVPDTESWLGGDWRDIPFPGDRMEPGQPICTVLATGEDRAECWQSLLMNADAVRQEVGEQQEG
jgi:hypothetical protein